MVAKFNGHMTLLNPSDRMSLNKSAGALIRDLRNKKKISGEVLSGFIGVSQQQISRYERGKTELTLSKLQKIAYFFGLNFWQFIDLLYSHHIQCSGSLTGYTGKRDGGDGNLILWPSAGEPGE
ncbi:TPA: helix-turn-helix domain-containing protein [Morganella morganii]|uniref:helix-turn-helix domain-containing protein n=1 Tax=Morganella morganii TaxID=582 RepID=UPI0034D78255